MTRTSSTPEKPLCQPPRKLTDWLNPDGQRKVHSMIDKVTEQPGYDRVAWISHCSISTARSRGQKTFPIFMRRAVPPARLVAGTVVLMPLLLGYKAGAVSGQLVRAGMVGVGLRAVSEERTRAIGRRFAKSSSLR